MAAINFAFVALHLLADRVWAKKGSTVNRAEDQHSQTVDVLVEFRPLKPLKTSQREDASLAGFTASMKIYIFFVMFQIPGWCGVLAPRRAVELSFGAFRARPPRYWEATWVLNAKGDVWRATLGVNAAMASQWRMSQHQS
ncbi:hypothetical protein DFH06DRAFT_155104 [Mycena polygramma]|nr:hypothetical protein DFH06DRAFT_155104 [Mycena polygramma]